MKLSVGYFYRVKRTFTQWINNRQTNKKINTNDILFIMKINALENMIVLTVINQNLEKFSFEFHSQNTTLFLAQIKCA